MKGIIRMLMMFGPMLYRQYQKYTRNKAQQQSSQHADREIGREQKVDNQQDNDIGGHA